LILKACARTPRSLPASHATAFWIKTTVLPDRIVQDNCVFLKILFLNREVRV